MSIFIRKATRQDALLILQFIRDLAIYEKLLDEVTTTVADIENNLFDGKFAECIIAEWEGVPAGFALFFHNYSTFLGKPGLYLEDLFVKPAHRGKGIGKELLVELARIAVERNCGRLEWAVLDWNTPSIDFYRSLGAVAMDEWTIFRITGESLQDLGRIK